MTETKERAPLAWPEAPAHDDEGGVTVTDAALDLDAARAALAAEWRAADPQTPDDVARFYREAHGLASDLAAWHALPARQEWTRMLVHVAQQAAAQCIVDIGCGAGHDLLALHEALPDHQMPLEGVEPNTALRESLPLPIVGLADVRQASLEHADLLICIDVLEHVPDPESVLGSIARRAPVGCLLFETCATHDTGTPLHLPANRGWHPGHVLEGAGWELVDHEKAGRVRVWRRIREAGGLRAGALLCAYRSVSLGTFGSLLDLCAGDAHARGNRWRLTVKAGDSLIARSRSILMTAWYRETNDDVALFVDDDVVFAPSDADRLAELCRAGHDIVCGAYPVHNGAHLACRTLPGTQELSFGPGRAPVEIAGAATGFMAVHRRVLDALVPHMELCHPDQPWSHWVLFAPEVVRNPQTGLAEHLSEDWAFCERARAAGFGVWLDPQTRLVHTGEVGVSVRNMAQVHHAINQV